MFVIIFGLLSSQQKGGSRLNHSLVKYTKNKLNFRVVFFKFVPVYGVKKIFGLLFLLMPVFSESFFTLVNRHLMPFPFFSTWHACISFKLIIWFPSPGQQMFLQA